jgi:hypothetical protein
MPHTCHWPGCGHEIPASLFMCKKHWFALPRALRQEIWRTYRSGQEVTKDPSREYMAAALAAVGWAHEHGAASA